MYGYKVHLLKKYSTVNKELHSKYLYMYYKQIPNSGETRSVISWERGEVNRNQNGSFCVFKKIEGSRDRNTILYS